MARQEFVYDGCGRRVGWVEIDERGNKRVCSMTKGVVGYYYKDTNRTVEASSGRIVGFGDLSTTLLFK